MKNIQSGGNLFDKSFDPKNTPYSARYLKREANNAKDEDHKNWLMSMHNRLGKDQFL